MDLALNPPTNEISDHALLSSTHYDVLTRAGDPVAADLPKEDYSKEEYLPEPPPNGQIRANYVPSPHEEGCSLLTTDQGEPIYDNQNSLKVGNRGSTLLQDHKLREKIMSFDHERIPERVVHARGSGAYGEFTAYSRLIPFREGTISPYNDMPIQEITMAHFLQGEGQKTPTFVRFSQVIGSKGSSDTVRDARGFATKFYTEEGVYDLVGNNIPVFFIQDGIMFPDLVHAIKPQPDSEMPQTSAAHDNFWDFISLTPESMHMILWVLSDIGVMASYRLMEGAGVNTFTMINQNGRIRFVKFHWKPREGIRTMTWKQAQKLAGEDPDYLRRDLWEAIKREQYPVWDLCIQIMPIEDEYEYEFDPLDPTKIWDEERFPFFRIGEMILNRNPSNHFAEVEQSAFHPGHVVPGIDFSNDSLLHARLFSYLDTQITRVGVNFADLPVNRPLNKVRNNQRDGKARIKIHRGPVNYDPNTRSGGCPMSIRNIDPSAPQPASQYQEGYKVRERGPKWHDHFSQPRRKYELMTPEQKDHLVSAFHYELGHVYSIPIRRRMINLIRQVHEELAERVAAGLVL